MSFKGAHNNNIEKNSMISQKNFDREYVTNYHKTRNYLRIINFTCSQM